MMGSLRRLLLATACCGAWIPTTSALAESGAFDSDGVKIFYQVEGSGPPVVLIHGYRATGDLNWRIPGVNRLLAPDYRLITIDNRGHGRSDRPDSAEMYGEKMAEDVIRLMDHLKIRKAHLVGYSMGGMITLNIVARYPDRVLSGLVGGMGWMPKGPIVSPILPDRSPEVGSPALRACARAFADLGITREELAKIKVPLEVLIGKEDGLYERRVKPLQEVRPDVPVVLVPGATHMSCLFKPEFKSGIKEWLDKQPKPAGDSEKK